MAPLAAGEHPKIVQEMVGHQSVPVTPTLCHQLMPELGLKKRAAARLDPVWAPSADCGQHGGQIARGGEPHFRELEPAGGVAAAPGQVEACRLMAGENGGAPARQRDASLSIDGQPEKTTWARGDVQFVGRGVAHEATNTGGKPVDMVVVAIR